MTTFNKPFTISVTYSNEQASAAREGTLSFYRLSPNVWRTTDIIPVAQSANQITGTAAKTGIFAVLGEAKLTYFPIIFKN